MKQAPYIKNQLRPYIILRRTQFGNRGQYNGYVSLPTDHPWHGVDYDDLNTKVNVHGCLTYSQMENSRWVIGFDTCHNGDTPEHWSVDTVAAEAESLLEQAEHAYKL